MLSWQAAACMQDREAQHDSITDHFKQPYHAMAAKIKQTKKSLSNKTIQKRVSVRWQRKFVLLWLLVGILSWTESLTVSLRINV